MAVSRHAQPGSLQCRGIFSRQAQGADRQRDHDRTEDDQLVSIHRSRKTKFLKGTQTIKPSDIDLETLVTVDASEEVDLTLTAVSVTVDTPKKSADGK